MGGYDVDVPNGTAVGLLHPGSMGAAIGGVLVAQGLTVWWASHGRSDQTRARAEAAGLTDAETVPELARRCDVILSICPPHAAAEVAGECSGFEGVYVDANAVAPATARIVAETLSPPTAMVDGGIIGPPPTRPGDTRLYLSGHRADEVADLFAGSMVDARLVPGGVGAASALKLAYAAWTKGSAALVLTARDLATAEGVEDILMDEWALSQPALAAQLSGAESSAAGKGWRWVAEMEEIAAAMAANGLPDGFHRAAAAVFRAATTPPAAD